MLAVKIRDTGLKLPGRPLITVNWEMVRKIKSPGCNPIGQIGFQTAVLPSITFGLTPPDEQVSLKLR